MQLDAQLNRADLKCCEFAVLQT
jgi:hypothetical protein